MMLLHTVLCFYTTISKEDRDRDFMLEGVIVQKAMTYYDNT
jgi:hypothetical protein